jgi:hypothetical protein
MMAIALLILAIPAMASAQIVYQRSVNQRDRYDRIDRRDVRDAINRLDNSAVQLERDLNTGRERRVLGGLFWVKNVDNNAVAEVRDFRQAVRELRRSFRGDALGNSTDEARLVIDRGIQLDRYLRLRTGSANVDADLADLRSNLHVLAEAYGMSLRY